MNTVILYLTIEQYNTHWACFSFLHMQRSNQILLCQRSNSPDLFPFGPTRLRLLNHYFLAFCHMANMRMIVLIVTIFTSIKVVVSHNWHKIFHQSSQGKSLSVKCSYSQSEKPLVTLVIQQLIHKKLVRCLLEKY